MEYGKAFGIDFEEIDPDIREVVYLFNKAGYKTIYSCEGHWHRKEEVKAETGEESVYPIYDIPYITFEKPDNNLMLNFVINGMTCMMEIVINHYLDFKDIDENDCVDLKQYFANHENAIPTVNIYMSQNICCAAKNETEFHELRKKFLQQLKDMANDLVKCVEACNELNVRI